MSTLDCRAFLYVIPTKAEVTVIDSAFHKMGDVNWDGYIDVTDLDLLKKAFGKTAEEAPECDLNGDGIVDIADVLLCSINQEKVAPTYYTPFKAEVSKGTVIATAVRGVQKLKATAFVENTKKILFFFSAFGLLGRPIVR